MESSEYFFINKTSKSDCLSRSDPQERRAIGAYIQGRRVWGTTRIRSPGINDHGQEPSVTEDQMVKTAQKAHLESELHVCNKTPFDSLSEACSSRCRIEEIWKFTAYDFVLDPFHTSCMPIDTNAHELLYYFVRHYEPSTRYIETMVFSKKAAPRERQSSMMCLQDILCNQMETNALLAAMAARMQDVESVDQKGKDLVYTNRAMSAIARSIKGAVGNAPRVFRAIFFLLVVAWHHQDTMAFQTHLKAMKTILDSIGGLRETKQAIKTVLIRFDATVSAERFGKPNFASTQFETSQEDQVWLTDKILSSKIRPILGQQLINGAHQHMFGHELHELISGLVENIRVIEWQFALSHSCPRLVDLVARKIDLIRHQLLELDVVGTQQRIIHMSILIWISMVLTSEGTSRSVQLMVTALRDLLSDGQGIEWHDCEPLHVWALSVGAMAAEDNSPTQMYLISELKKSLADAEYATFDSQEDLVQFLRSFLYLHCAQAPLVQSLAKHIVA